MKFPGLILFVLMVTCGTQHSSAQTFTPAQQHELDSLNSILDNPKSHDTSVVQAYVGLSEILYVSNLDTLGYLCNKAKVLAEQVLATNPPTQIQKALNISLAGALNNIGYDHSNQGEIPLALEYYHKSLKIYEEIKDKKGMASSYNNIGFIHYNQGEITLALEYFHKGLKIKEEINDKKGMAYSYNNIGVIHHNQGDIPLALEYYHKSLKIQEEINDKQGMADSYNNIGAIHEDQGEIPLALEYYHKSLKIREEINDKHGMANSYNNIGVIHDNQASKASPDPDNHRDYRDRERLLNKALEYFHKSLKIREEINYKKGMAQSYINIGGIHSNQGEIPLALEYYHKSLKIREEINDKQGMAESYIKIAKIAFKRRQVGGLKGALALATKSLKISKEIGFPENIEQASGLLSKIYSKQGNYKKALEMRNIEVQMRDSLASEEAIKAAVNQQAKYEYEKQKALDDAEHEKQQAIEAANHEKRMAIEQEEKARQRIIIYSTISGFILIAIFLIFVFNRLRITRTQKDIIQKQKYLVDEANEELNQTNEELAAQRDQIEHQRSDLENKNSHITASITYAKRIQDALLKSEEHESKHFPPHFILFKPKDIVSGDFYWVLEKQGHMYMAAADCTGHGVPGAFLTMLGTSFLNEINSTPELLSPSQILDTLRERIVKELSQTGAEGESKDGMDISLMRLELKTNKLEWSGANNPLYILKKGSSEIKVTKGDREPIGYAQTMTSFTDHQLKLSTGDTIFIFTDGYADQFGGEHNKKFGYKQMRELLLKNVDIPMEEQKAILSSSFERWINIGTDEQIDDVCVIGIKI